MQKITPKKIHKSLPAFSPLENRSFKVFHKNYPKHVYKLEINCTVGSFLQPARTKKILMNLIRLTKKSSKFRALQYLNLSQYLNARDSQALYVIKKFRNVQSLGLIWDFCDTKTQNETRKWLRSTSRFNNLLFGQTESISGRETTAESENLNIKLGKDLQRRKIRKIIHSILPSEYRISDHYILNMGNFPSTIQEMSLDLSKCSFVIDSGKTMSHLVSMEKFSMLTKLELLFPLEIEIALLLIRTIPNPHLLTSLGLYLQNDSDQNLAPIFDFICNLHNLEKLGLRLTHTTNKLELLNELSLQFKLRTLSLWIYAETDQHLQDLAAVILATGNLESLHLNVSFNSDSICKKPFLDVYQRMGQLARLKRLCLEFGSQQQDVKIKSAYSDLIRCLGSLNQLEELSLWISETNLSFEFQSILEGLAKTAHQLKRFSMNFMGSNFSEEDELGLIDLLGKMKGLEELDISQFSFKHSLLKFKEVLEGFEGLKKMEWMCFDVSIEESEKVFELVISILAKKGVQECKFYQNYQKYPKEMTRNILIGEILQINPSLRVGEVSLRIIENSLRFRI